jgi:hypothetical protein
MGFLDQFIRKLCTVDVKNPFVFLNTWDKIILGYFGWMN